MNRTITAKCERVQIFRDLAHELRQQALNLQLDSATKVFDLELAGRYLDAQLSGQ